MSDEKPHDRRSRDDSRLRRSIGELRERMAEAGIEEKPFDWDAMIHAERGLRWRARWHVALQALPALAARVPAQLAEAALEVAFDAGRHTAAITVESARACMSPDSRMEFSYALPGQRPSLGPTFEKQQSTGVFLTSKIPGARIVADERRKTVTIDFLDAASRPLVLLVAEDPNETARIAEAAPAGPVARAVFENVPNGSWLLAVCP